MDITIKHKSGRKNTNADALSRCHSEGDYLTSRVCAIGEEPTVKPDFSLPDLMKISESQLRDYDTSVMMVYLQDGTLPEEEKLSRRIVLESRQFTLTDGVLYHENPVFPGRWCVVTPAEFRSELLEEAHRGRFAGHLSAAKVYDRLRRYVWWRGMKSDVHKFCKACLVCHSVHLAKEVEEIVCRHGIPEKLLSDRGTNFLSSLIQEVCQLLGVKKINTSGYHPQTDGLIEKFNSTLINMIAKSCDVKERNWDDYLPYLLFAYRVSAQSSTKESPFFLVYGRDPRIPTKSVLSHSRSPYAIDVEDYKEDLLTNLSLAWKSAAQHIKQAQSTQKAYYDRTSKESGLKPGDRVMVFMPAETKTKDHKLVRPFHGPYRVLHVTPTNAEVRLVDQPNSESIFVSLNRVRLCYSEQGDSTWTGHCRRRRRRKGCMPDTPSTSDSATLLNSGPVTRSKSKLNL